MNYTKHLFYAFVCLLAFASCQKEDHGGKDTDEQSDNRKMNEWTAGVMRNYYLWYEDIPADSKLDYEAEPVSFFRSLLSDKDGKDRVSGHQYFSSISKVSETKALPPTDGSVTYGIDYMPYLVGTDESSYYFLRVNYVLPHSPASEAGIQRGDWIVKQGDNVIENPYSLSDGGATKLTLARFDDQQMLNISAVVSLPAARVVENSPFLLDTVYTLNNKKVAYLVYNHFSSGLNDDYEDQTYNNQMRDIFAGFKSHGVTECILDLRYNGGGLVTSANLLTSLLAPKSALNGVFCIERFNDRQNPREQSIAFTKDAGVNSANLDLKRLYVIVSERSASASELVINSLRAYLGGANVVLIGTQTLGKNVGSLTYESTKDLPYKISPIAFYVFNKDREANYNNGFTPDILFDEYDIVDEDFFLLGDTKERILKLAMAQIDGSVSSLGVKSDRSAGSGSTTLRPLRSFVPRQPISGLIDFPR